MMTRRDSNCRLPGFVQLATRAIRPMTDCTGDVYNFAVRQDHCQDCKQLISDILYLEICEERWRSVFVRDPRRSTYIRRQEMLSFKSHGDGTVRSLKSSSQGGCQCCGMLLRHLALKFDRDEDRTYTICRPITGKYDFHPGCNLYIVFGHPGAKGFGAFDRSNLMEILRAPESTSAASGCCMDHLPRPFLPSQDPGSRESFDSVCHWLNLCYEQDVKCVPKSSVLPKRVLDLRAVDTNNRLTLFRTKGEEAPYATLSYCWGQGRTLKTTNATMQ